MDNLKHEPAAGTPTRHHTTPPRTTSGSTQRARGQLHTAWGNHLKSYEWDWVATLTPRYADYPAGRLQREFINGFIRRLSWRAGASVPWFAATEVGAGNVVHIHALLAAKAGRIDDVRACWKLGISDVTGYDNGGDVTFYLSKSFTLPDGSLERWDCSRTMPARRTAKPGGDPLRGRNSNEEKESSFSPL